MLFVHSPETNDREYNTGQLRLTTNEIGGAQLFQNVITELKNLQDILKMADKPFSGFA